MKYVYGYARVSTKSQDLQRQLDILEKYNCDEILTEKITGTKKSRPQINHLKSVIRKGDTLVIESWSRLGRSTKDLIELMEYFSTKGVTVISNKENFDTHTPQGKLMLTVFQAFAEFERDLISQRTKEGLSSARARGRVGGRPRANLNKIKQALELYDSGKFTVTEIRETTGVARSTLYKYINERKYK